MEFSRSGYYAAVKRRQIAPPVRTASIDLRAAFTASGRMHGGHSLCAALDTLGVTIGRPAQGMQLDARQRTEIGLVAKVFIRH